MSFIKCHKFSELNTALPNILEEQSAWLSFEKKRRNSFSLGGVKNARK
jgi:hypothetical protein